MTRSKPISPFPLCLVKALGLMSSLNVAGDGERESIVCVACGRTKLSRNICEFLLSEDCIPERRESPSWLQRAACERLDGESSPAFKSFDHPAGGAVLARGLGTLARQEAVVNPEGKSRSVEHQRVVHYLEKLKSGATRRLPFHKCASLCAR